METKFPSFKIALSGRNNTSKTDKNRLTESEEKGTVESLTDTKLENDVLRMRIKANEKNNETFNCLKNDEIDTLKATNEELNIKVGDQLDKIHQLDTSNDKKDSQIEGMKKRMEEMEKQLEEFVEQKDKLEQNILEMKVMNDKSIEEKASQGEKIHKLESELEDVKTELKSIREQKESFEKCIQIAQEKQTQQLQIAQEKQTQQLQIAQEKQTQQLQIAQEKQTQQLQIMLRETIEETMKRELAKTKPRQEPCPAAGGTDIQMNDVGTVQINVHSKNGRNIVAQTSRSTINQKVVKQFNMPFPK